MRTWEKGPRLDHFIGAKILRIGYRPVAQDARRIVNNTDDRIAFETDRGVFGFACESDCCSETWIWHINGVSNALGAVVVKFEKVDMPAPPGDPLYPNDQLNRQDKDKAYCFRVTTSGGVLDVEFRNSSNGYYGGSMEFDPECLTLDGYRILDGDFDAGKVAI